MERTGRHQARFVVGGLHSESANGDVYTRCLGAGLCLKALCFHAPMIGGLGRGVDLKRFRSFVHKKTGRLARFIEVPANPYIYPLGFQYGKL
jgi:hypothetical protein